jgi:hypothetical protein
MKMECHYSSCLPIVGASSTPALLRVRYAHPFLPLPPPLAMHLYNLTLQPPTAITHAIVGNFSGARHQEIIVSRGTRLELLRVDMQTGKLSTVVSTDVFGTIRSLAGFRLTGGTKGELSSLVRIRPFTSLEFTFASVFFLRPKTTQSWARTLVASSY